MKSLYIVNTSLCIGGVEKSLLNFIENMKDNYDITLGLLKKEGPFLSFLPDYVKVEEISKHFDNIPKNKFTNFIYKILKIFYLDKVYRSIKRKTIKNTPINQNTYDIALCFDGTSIYCNDYVLNKVAANKKFAIFHNDVTNKVFINNPQMIQQLKSYDKVLCVSKSASEKFCETYKEFTNIDYLYNFQNIEDILKRSKEKCEFSHPNKEVWDIVSINQLTEQKAIERSIPIFAKLKDDGINFVWSIFGEGLCRKNIEELITKYNLNEEIKLMGFVKNPYSYLKDADFLYLGSFWEGCPMVYAEAMSLQVPVVSTNNVSAHEILDNYGIVCDNNEESIYKCLKDLLTNKDKILKLKKGLSNYRFDNKEIVEHFSNL